jgi:hypothetical protein
MDFDNVTDGELINELEARGYMTDLLFSREDVKMRLESINEDREDEGLELFTMTEEQMDDALLNVSTDWFVELFNERLSDEVFYICSPEEEDGED